MPRVKARKDDIVRESTGNVEKWLRGTPNVTVIQGHGRFESAHAVRVGDRLLLAPQIFINTGGRPTVPSLGGLTNADYLTSTGMMEVDFLPEHLIVIGGSYVGLEFAQMYRRFGSRVTVIEMAPRLIAREDEAVSEAVRSILEGEGVAIRLNAKCLSAERRAEGVAVTVSCDEDPRDVAGSHLLLAVGRVPNTDDLGLDRAGVSTDARGFIPVDDQLATNVPGIFALGDVNGRGAFTHTAYNDFEIVAANLLDDDPRRVSDRFPRLRAVHRSAVGTRGHDGTRSTRIGTSGAGGTARDGARRPCARARRDAGLHASAGGRRNAQDPGRGAARDRGR